MPSFAARPLLLSLILVALPVFAATGGQDGKLTTEQREQLAKAKALGLEALRHYRDADFEGARSRAEQKLDLETKVLGPDHPDLAASLALIAEIMEDSTLLGPEPDARKARFAAARKFRERALALVEGRFGKDAWQTRDARLALALHDKLAPLSRDDIEALHSARTKEHQVLGQAAGHTFTGGVQTYAVPSLCTVEGSGGGLSKFTRNTLFQDVHGAEATLAKVLEVRAKILGADHPHCAATWNNLASLYYSRGDLARAADAYDKALAINLKALGEPHPLVATSLGNLALVRQLQGDFAGALRLSRRSREGFILTLGKDHPQYALALNNLAGLYVATGDFTSAENAYRRALAIFEKELPAQTHNCAICLNNLAGLQEIRGDLPDAEVLLKRCLALLEDAGRGPSLEYAGALNNLALNYQQQGKLDDAQKLYAEALKVQTATLGPEHLDCAVTLNNQATLLRDLGKLAEAEKVCKQALAIRTKLLPADHPARAAALTNLAGLYECSDRQEEAGRLYEEALEICRKSVHLASASQSERQQLAMLRVQRRQLDAYLSFCLRTKRDLTRAYEAVLPWKGAVFERQQRLRLARSLAKDKPEQAKVFAELQKTASALANLTFVQPADGDLPAWHNEIASLSKRYEQLEADLAGLSPEFARGVQPRSAALAKALPVDAALVDFLEYLHSEPARTGKPRQQRRLVAFVLRGGSLAAVELGAAEPVDRAIEQWRLQIASQALPKAGESPAQKVRKLVWEPLEPHLKNCKTALIAPDGSLTRLPFAALPGKAEGKYLLEETAVALVPVPQLLPEILGPPPQSAGPPSLLLVGEVDYGKEYGGEAGGLLPGKLGPWPALPGTRAEIVAIKDSFETRYDNGKPLALRKAKATELAVRELAPKYRWLHFATHGFFAPESVRSSLRLGDGRGGLKAADARDLAGFHPGLLSGLVLANANSPEDPRKDDGLLTALEVAELDLAGVELVVLSACETGLGEAAGGEGVLGLQRAFQIAGARTVIASLWRVPDNATKELMVAFYDKLLAEDGKLTKLEALRQAQLWMLREGTSRGFTLTDEVPMKGRGAAPYYWAAFVLSGDVR